MSSPRPREPSHRALTTLVHSTNPHTRLSRTDDAKTAKDKEDMAEELIDLARQALMARPLAATPPSTAEQQQMTDRVRSRLSRTTGGRDTLPDFEALVDRLSRIASPPAELPSMVSFIYQMAFTGRSSSSAAAAHEPRTSRASPMLGGHTHQMDRISSRASLASSAAAGPSRLTDSQPPSRLADGNRRVAGSTRSADAGLAERPRSPAIDAKQRPPSRPGTAAESAQGADDAGEAATDGAAPSPASPSPPLPPPPSITDEELGIGKVPKSVSLERWRSACGSPLVGEEDLLRDVIFILQGIDGRYVRFEQIKTRVPHDEGVIRASVVSEETSPSIKVTIQEPDAARIPRPTRHLIHRLAEGGKHYQRITAFVRSQATREKCGRIMQSLCHFIDRELAEYYELICDLEVQLNQGPAKADAVPDDPAQAREAAKRAAKDALDAAHGALTLKKVAMLTEQALLRMRFMSSLVEGAQHTHGGSLVSLIHNYTFNGDPFIREFTERLLEEVSRSFFQSLSRWIYEGELQDPFGEFFVELNPNPHSAANDDSNANANGPEYPDEIDAAALWENKFLFQASLVPTFLGETPARKIFSAGKSLNFIRYSCGDSDWKDTREAMQTQSKDASSSLRYADLLGLERTIDTVHSTVSKRLLDIFLDKFKLQKHLRAINDYLLLTNGDFSELLLESLSPILHRQASLLYRHSLTAALETAIRGSNAQNDDEEVLRRLDARILEFSGAETGWETFTLEYRVDSPVNTVLDAGAMAEYQQIFLHLWKMKRVEMCLNASFATMLTATNGLLRIRKKQQDEVVAGLRREAHRVLGLLAEMTHFMRQLQGYNQLEVIAYSWQDLQNFFEKRSGDLDVLIAAHRGYLGSLHGKIFLRGGTGKRGGGSSDHLASELRSNFDTILAFTSATNALATYIIDTMARRGLSEEQLPAMPPHIPHNIQVNATDFKERTDGIIARLERHGNLVIRDLSVRLDYNGYYAKLRSERGRERDGVTREPSSGR